MFKNFVSRETLQLFLIQLLFPAHKVLTFILHSEEIKAVYLPIHQAAEYLGVPIIRLQKIKHDDIKSGRNGRFVYKDNKWHAYVSGMGVDFPENEKLKNDFWKFRAYFKSELEMARVIDNKNFMSEYQNLRNFNFKNPEHSRRVYETLERYTHSHPLLLGDT